MQAEELMIGDWVNWWHPRKQRYIPIKIGIEYFSSDFCGNELKPISLTQEILEKNGWVDADYSITDSPNNNFLPEDTEHKLELMVGCGNTIQWTINTGEYIIMEIKYVHQLQHALKFCEIEKEIML